jgi:hypothetical protein
MSEFNTLDPQLGAVNGTNCTGGNWVPEVVENQTIDCFDAPVVECETDACPNIDNYQATLPDGYHFETINNVPECIKDIESTPNPDVCPTLEGIQYEVPNDYHIAADKVNCVQFGQAGPEPRGPSNPSNPQVLGAVTGGTGTVLGATTMAKTGVAEENIMNLMFAFGILLTTFGIRKFSSSKVK